MWISLEAPDSPEYVREGHGMNGYGPEIVRPGARLLVSLDGQEHTVIALTAWLEKLVWLEDERRVVPLHSHRFKVLAFDSGRPSDLEDALRYAKFAVSERTKG